MVKCIYFPALLEKVEDNIYNLNYLHGPTLVFKDFVVLWRALAACVVMEKLLF